LTQRVSGLRGPTTPPEFNSARQVGTFRIWCYVKSAP
jgi:hypothetical protein